MTTSQSKLVNIHRNILSYILLIIFVCSFCLIATNISMSQELEYGDRVCDVREENVTALEDYLRAQGINTTAEDYCGDNKDYL